MTTRTFIAIELPPEVRATLARRIEHLRHLLPTIRWANSASLHLTLAFLGELDDATLAGATEAATLAAQECAPFSLRLAGLGIFGPPRAPRVIWAGIAGDVPALLALYAGLTQQLAARGLPTDSRPFSPHLTLARLKQPPTAQDAGQLATALAEPPPTTRQPVLRVEHLSVMKSELLRPAARYTCLHSCPLRSIGETNDTKKPKARDG